MHFGTIGPRADLPVGQRPVPALRLTAGAALAHAEAGRASAAAGLCADLVLRELPALADDRAGLLLVVQALLVAGRLEQLSRLLRAVSGAAVSVMPGRMGGALLIAGSRCPRTGTLLLAVDLGAVAGAAAAQAAATLLGALPD